MSEKSFIRAVVLAGLALRVAAMVQARGTLIDDSYITLRYGRNLLLGRGLVFNPGEPALGAPPLYSAVVGLLWRLGRLLGDERLIGYLVSSLNILLMGACCFLLYGILRPAPEAGRPTGALPQRGPTAWLAFLPLVLLALYLPFVDNTITGMETTLFLFLQLLSLRAFVRGRPALGALALGLLVLVRVVEGSLWAVVVLAGETRLGWRPSLRALAPLVAIGLAWVLMSFLFYGSPLPLHALAKSGWLVTGDNGGAATAARQLRDVLVSFSLLPIDAGAAGWMRVAALACAPLVLLLFGLGLADLWRRRDPRLAFGLFFLACAAAHVAGRAATWPSWYAIPPGLALYVTVGFGATALAARGAPARGGATVPRAARDGALALAALALLATSWTQWNRIRMPYYRSLEASYATTGRYLRAHAAPRDSLLIWEVGYIGWLADRYTQEVAGIVSPRIYRLRRADPAAAECPALVRRFRPSFVVLPAGVPELAPAAMGEWFRSDYHLAFTTPAYLTYARVPAADSARAGEPALPTHPPGAVAPRRPSEAS